MIDILPLNIEHCIVLYGDNLKCNWIHKYYAHVHINIGLGRITGNHLLQMKSPGPGLAALTTDVLSQLWLEVEAERGRGDGEQEFSCRIIEHY